MIKGGVTLILFAAAIKILSSVCLELSKLSWEDLAKGLVGVVVLMGALVLFLNNAKLGKGAIGTAINLVILAVGIKILASACADLGQLSWETISKGLITMTLLLAELAVFSKMSGNVKGLLSTSLALINMGFAMKIVADAMVVFGSMSWEQIGRGLSVMGGALAELILAVRLMPKKYYGNCFRINRFRHCFKK